MTQRLLATMVSHSAPATFYAGAAFCVLTIALPVVSPARRSEGFLRCKIRT